MEPFKITLFNTVGKTMTTTHFHDNYELFFLLEGKRDFFIKNHTYSVQPRDLVFISPKVIHKTIIRESPFQKRYAMMIPKDFISSLALNYDDNLFECFQNPSPILKIDGEKYTHILNLFNQIYEEYESSHKHKDFILSILVAELLFYLNRYHQEIQPNPVDTDKTLSRQAIDILLASYKESLVLDDIAKQLFVSTFQLCRIFKQETGFTVMEYLTYVRLREAMRLLDSTNDSITDISFLAGFNNINHFIRTFKQHLGTTPKQYQLKRPPSV